MANNRNNVITHGSSGKMGNAVFTLDGKMRSKPDISKRVWSPSQKEHLGLFERAKEYARMAISDPELNDYYAAKAKRKHGLGAWHLAIKDFCSPPRILAAEFRRFTGKSGDELYITANDDFEIAGVSVAVFSQEGILLEEGNASECEFRINWLYRLKSDINLVRGLNVTISAKDLPGNMASATLIWPFECDREILISDESLPGSAKKKLKSQLRVKKI
jgi:hypothetical protein